MKKVMQMRTLSLVVMTLILCLGLVGCGGSSDAPKIEKTVDAIAEAMDFTDEKQEKEEKENTINRNRMPPSRRLSINSRRFLLSSVTDPNVTGTSADLCVCPKCCLFAVIILKRTPLRFYLHIVFCDGDPAFCGISPTFP